MRLSVTGWHGGKEELMINGFRRNAREPQHPYPTVKHSRAGRTTVPVIKAVVGYAVALLCANVRLLFRVRYYSFQTIANIWNSKRYFCTRLFARIRFDDNYLIAETYQQTTLYSEIRYIIVANGGGVLRWILRVGDGRPRRRYAFARVLLKCDCGEPLNRRGFATTTMFTTITLSEYSDPLRNPNRVKHYYAKPEVAPGGPWAPPPTPKTVMYL
jgi:hypothetical protein